MAPSPIVSVIVAAYDAADDIEAAVASARAQTLADIEIVVVDDASRDATRRIVAGIAERDARVRLIALDRNGGPGVARNAGIASARGEWVAVLDADDAFAPDRLAHLVAVAAETGADVVADNLTLESPTGSERLLAVGPDALFELDAETFIAANKGGRDQGRVLYGFLKPMIRRAFLRENGLAYEPLRLAEDYFLGLDCLVHGGRWFVSGRPTYRYAVREGSLTASYTPDHLDAMARVDRLFLAKDAVRAQPGVARAVRGHLRAVTRAATWTRFVQAVRARRLGTAARITLGDAGAARDVMLEGWAAAPRLVRRGLGRLAPARSA